MIRRNKSTLHGNGGEQMKRSLDDNFKIILKTTLFLYFGLFFAMCASVLLETFYDFSNIVFNACIVLSMFLLTLGISFGIYNLFGKIRSYQEYYKYRKSEPQKCPHCDKSHRESVHSEKKCSENKN